MKCGKQMMMRTQVYCTCGASWSARNVPLSAWRQIMKEWKSAHNGEGHAPCDAHRAARARRKDP